MSVPQSLTRQIVPPSPGLTADDVVGLIRTEITEAAEANADIVPITTSPGCDGQPEVNALDGSSEAPDASGLELGLVGPGGQVLPGGGLGGGVPGVGGDVNVGGTCYGADGMATDALCSSDADAAALDADIGALLAVGEEPPEVITSHVIVGFDGGTEPGTRYDGTGTAPSSLGPPPVIVYFTGDGTQLCWSTQGGASVTIDGGIGTVDWQGCVGISPTSLMVYTLTVTSSTGATQSQTVTVAPDGPVIVDSVGNVFMLTESGGMWTAAYLCKVTELPTPAARPVPSGASHIEHVPEEETWPDSYRGYFGSRALDYFLGDSFNIAPLCDWTDKSAQGLPTDMPLVSTANVWDIERDVHIHSGAISLVYIEGASTGYEGTGVDVVALATLDAENWRFYNPDFTYFALGIRPCVVSWGSDAPYVGLADVLTVGGTTASLRILEAGPETAMVGPTWAVQQTVTIPTIGAGGAARVEPTWWKGGTILGGQLSYS